MNILIIIFLFAFSHIFANDELEFSLTEHHQQKLDKQKRNEEPYFLDYFLKSFNMTNKECPFCLTDDSAENIGNKLKERGLKRNDNQLFGHCSGFAIFF